MGEAPFYEWVLNYANTFVMLGVNLIVHSTFLVVAGLCSAYGLIPFRFLTF